MQVLTLKEEPFVKYSNQSASGRCSGIGRPCRIGQNKPNQTFIFHCILPIQNTVSHCNSKTVAEA